VKKNNLKFKIELPVLVEIDTVQIGNSVPAGRNQKENKNY
jgi:hypothetical protein